MVGPSHSAKRSGRMLKYPPGVKERRRERTRAGLNDAADGRTRTIEMSYNYLIRDESRDQVEHSDEWLFSSFFVKFNRDI